MSELTTYGKDHSTICPYWIGDGIILNTRMNNYFVNNLYRRNNYFINADGFGKQYELTHNQMENNREEA